MYTVSRTLTGSGKLIGRYSGAWSQSKDKDRDEVRENDWVLCKDENLGMSISRYIYARTGVGGVPRLKIAGWRAVERLQTS